MPSKPSLDETGLNTVSNPHQNDELNYLWVSPGIGKSSKEVYDAVNVALRGNHSIDKVRVLNSLNVLIAEGALSFYEITPKGVHRRKRILTINESWNNLHNALTVMMKLIQEFPEEPWKAI